MPVFEDFNRNGKLISVRNEPLTRDNLPRYLEEHSSERALGYADALSDLLRVFGHAIWQYYNPSRDAGLQTAVVRSKVAVIESFKEREQFLHYLSDKLKSEGTEDTLESPMSPSP